MQTRWVDTWREMFRFPSLPSLPRTSHLCYKGESVEPTTPRLVQVVTRPVSAGERRECGEWRAVTSSGWRADGRAPVQCSGPRKEDEHVASGRVVRVHDDNILIS
jgi:hypothetical protein